MEQELFVIAAKTTSSLTPRNSTHDTVTQIYEHLILANNNNVTVDRSHKTKEYYCQSNFRSSHFASMDPSQYFFSPFARTLPQPLASSSAATTGDNYRSIQNDGRPNFIVPQQQQQHSSLDYSGQLPFYHQHEPSFLQHQPNYEGHQTRQQSVGPSSIFGSSSFSAFMPPLPHNNNANNQQRQLPHATADQSLTMHTSSTAVLPRTTTAGPHETNALPYFGASFPNNHLSTTMSLPPPGGYSLSSSSSFFQPSAASNTAANSSDPSCTSFAQRQQQMMCSAAAAAAAAAAQNSTTRLMMLQNGAAFVGAAAAVAAAAATKFNFPQQPQQILPQCYSQSNLIGNSTTTLSVAAIQQQQQQQQSETAAALCASSSNAALTNQQQHRTAALPFQTSTNGASTSSFLNPAAQSLHIGQYSRSHHSSSSRPAQVLMSNSNNHHIHHNHHPHMATSSHHPPKPAKVYKCHECSYTSDRKNNLKRHHHTMHEMSEQLLECCAMRFSCKASLRMHTVMFHKHGYRCHYCSRNFCRKALLRRHLTVHTGQRDYQCSLCRYATSHRSNLERHRRVHHKTDDDGGGETNRSDISVDPNNGNAANDLNTMGEDEEDGTVSDTISTPSYDGESGKRLDEINEDVHSKTLFTNSMAHFSVTPTDAQNCRAAHVPATGNNKKPAFVSITSTHLPANVSEIVDDPTTAFNTKRHHHNSDETLTSIQSVAAAALRADAASVADAVVDVDDHARLQAQQHSAMPQQSRIDVSNCGDGSYYGILNFSPVFKNV